MVMFRCTVLQWALLLLLHPSSILGVGKVVALTLRSGQRIEPLPRSLSDIMPKSFATGLLDLRAVEYWATTQEDLKERHLKTLYRELLGKSSSNSNSEESSLFQRLVDGNVPHAAATSLLLLPQHNHQSPFQFVECTSKIVSVSPSPANGGCKLAIQYDGENGPIVETVLIRHQSTQQQQYLTQQQRLQKNNVNNQSASKRQKPAARYTVCVSSQVGCSRGCTFCATGTMGLWGNLSSSQILEQVWHAKRYLEGRVHGDDGEVRNVVLMGMGEPLDNYKEVHEACRGLTHQCLFGLAAKHVTISTVGATPNRIKRLADDMPSISLALSLHGATQKLREELIPSARGSSLEELAEALDYHAQATGKGTMIEYLLINGVNDGMEAADALGKFCIQRQSILGNRSTGTFVNLIPYNPTLAGANMGYQTPPDTQVNGFSIRLREEYGIRTLVRWSSASGRDADGACGQLVISRSPAISA